jgi:hypothetical protein
MTPRIQCEGVCPTDHASAVTYLDHFLKLHHGRGQMEAEMAGEMAGEERSLITKHAAEYSRKQGQGYEE